MRLTLLQLLLILAGGAVVFGLFVARGFTLAEHARILLTALGLCAAVGAAWVLVTAAEADGGWRRVGAVRAIVLVLAALAAAYLPALAFWLLGH